MLTKKKFTSILLTLALVISSLGIIAPGTTKAADIDPNATVVIAGSDYQNPGDNAEGAKVVTKLATSIKNYGYTNVKDLLFCGDYDYDLTYGVAQTQAGVNSLLGALEGVFGTLTNKSLATGNHDSGPGTAGTTASGANDKEKYGVFMINEDDYMWYNNNENTVKTTAANLKTYLDAKVAAKYTKPIFVLSHLPLHYSMRTYNDGDKKFAHYIFDELNAGAEAGLNIIFLFGHDHSNGWDDYLGGASIFLAPGDKINIAKKGNQKAYDVETLKFVYMNAGYTGYYNVQNQGVDSTLTMTSFEIKDDSVVINRFDQNGTHNLKAKGVANNYKSESTLMDYKPDTSIIGTGAVFNLNKSVGEGGAATTEHYEKITSASNINDGDKVLMVFNGDTPANIDSPGKVIMIPSVKEGDDGNGSIRVGYDLKAFSGNADATVENSAYANYVWTFTKSGSNWKIGADGKFMKLTSSSSQGIKAELDAASTDVFTIGGTTDAFTFTSGSNVLNYNKRGVINGYSSTPAGFILYKYVKGSGASVDKPVVATPEPTNPPAPGVSKKYAKVTHPGGMNDGDKILMIYDGNAPSNITGPGGKVFMIPSVVEKSNSSGTRKGFDIVSYKGNAPASFTSADYNYYEWKVTKAGNKWKLGDGSKFIKFTETSDMNITATLESTGEEFTISGTQDTLTFASGTTNLNYNQRGLINGYAGDPCSFIIYRVDDGKAVPTVAPTAVPTATPTPRPTKTPKPSATPDANATTAPADTAPTVAPTVAPVVPTVAPTTGDQTPVKASIKVVGKKIVKVGKTIKLKAKLTNVKGKVKWSVNKKKLATISKAGKLKAKKKGTVKVTAKVGKVKGSLKIKIK